MLLISLVYPIRTFFVSTFFDPPHEKDPDESIEEELLQEDGIEVQLPISKKRIPVEDRNIPVEDWFLESAYEDRTFIE